MKFILPVLIALLICGPPASAERPNVLFIAIDDLKPALGSFGDTFAKTPEMDRLAARGTVFLNNHCQQAMCAASRASLLTGMVPDRTGIWNFGEMMRQKTPDVVTLPQYFKQNGYESRGKGKIFDARNVDPAFDPVSWSIPFERPGSSDAGSESKVTTKIMDISLDRTQDGRTTTKAIEWMKEMAAEEKPFFLAVGLKKPHLPFEAPKAFWDLYPEDSIKVAPFQENAKNGPEIAYHSANEMSNYEDIGKKQRKRMELPEAKQKDLIRGYYACASMADALVGQLVQAVADLGLTEKTIVVVWGDHGWHLGDHELWCKHSIFEQATRSPLIIVDPTLGHAGVRVATPTEFVDIYPTLCELAGLEIPAGLDGVSLKPLMTGEKKSVKDVARSQWPKPFGGEAMIGYSVRSDRYRYTMWMPRISPDMPPGPVKFEEFYDYEKDPMEMVNHLATPEYTDQVASLRRRCAEIFKLPAGHGEPMAQVSE